MAATTKPATGNAIIDVPKPETKIKWVTLEEAKKFDRYLQKPFVPKSDESFAKKYFVRPISIIPYVPADMGSATGQTLYKFLCQKYYRNKTKSVSISDGKGGKETIDDNAPVEGHILNNNGFWECVDDTASFTIDCREFAEKYTADKIED